MAAVPMSATAAGDVVTRRLGTGLPPSPSRGRLPEAWVAPAKKAPRIDGKLDDPAWSETRPVVLGKLESHGEASPETEARLVHKDGVLFVGVRLAEPNVGAMKRTVTDADGPAYRDDSVELFLSPHPSRAYYQMIVSATGAIYDRHGHGNPSHWDSGANAAAVIGQDHWTLEVEIPMSAMGAAENMPTRWRANIYRNRRVGGRSESQAFSPTFRGDYDVPARFGHLLFTPTCPWADVEQLIGDQQGITIRQLDDGSSVLFFGLSTIPAGVRVHRARLRCDREPLNGLDDHVLKAIEILPLAKPLNDGSPPVTSGEPLTLVDPWYDAFDLTELVQRWVNGRGTAGVWGRSFPGWRKDRTFLDVMFDGQPERFPPAASDVKALHRAGQTFITWREISDPVGRDDVTWGEVKSILSDIERQRQTRYCVYRSARPITPQTLHHAKLIAEVKPLSGWNLAGRNIDRPIDRFISTERVLRWHQWNPFQNASIDGEFGRDCPIDRFVIRAGQPPLPRGTGLYVHTAAADERAYYAVVTAADGIENAVEIRSGLNAVGPVEETVADPEPVCQGELPPMPFFNFDQRRLHYVRWVAPPLSNRPYEYHNWTVGVPKTVRPGAALELNLHRDGYSYWRTHYRIEPGSVVVCPYDFPLKTFWYGYHECQGTLRSWSDGVVHNYTEKRLLSFVDWAADTWSADRNRILVTGCQGGASGSGALHLGLRRPDVFNMIVAGHGEPNYRGFGEPAERVWGKVAWGLKTENGRNVWDELDLLKVAKSLPPQTELPLISLTYSSNQEQTHDLAETLMAGGHAVVTHTAWGGQRLIPVSATATNWCLPLDIRKDRAMLAVFDSGETRDAVRNGSPLWRTEDMVDQPDQFAVTLQQGRGQFAGTITMRRLQRFAPQPGERCTWKILPVEVAAGNAREERVAQKGIVDIGRDGLLQIREARLVTGTYRLTIVRAE
jgi:hypothetical protein